MSDSAVETEKPERELITASRVKGSEVFNEAGEHIGHIEDISIEKASGVVRYALMSFGGFLGLGDRLHPLPWSMLTYDVSRGGYVVPLSTETLRGAPHYTAEELAAFGGRDVSYREALFAYYSAQPYW